MLSRYLVCKERFRVQYIEGLRPQPGFEAKIEYGQMWHVCEEALANGKPWEPALIGYCKGLSKIYPMNGQDISHWWKVCAIQFPIYVKYWSKHRDVKNRKPLAQEYVFDIPYQLPSGRMVRLRGKFDSVDLISNKVWLQENKTKSDIDRIKLTRQLSFDLQTMLYLTALLSSDLLKGRKLAGVRYNVIRRPLSGGKGSIRRHKATKNKPEESLNEFYQRLRTEVIEQEVKEAALEKRDCDYFCRFNVEVNTVDINRFRGECLDPILENLCCDYEWWARCHTNGWSPYSISKLHSSEFTHHRSYHYRFPYGVYNVLTEGGYSELDEYLLTGSEQGLVRMESLFNELQ